jgi:isopentenyl diphosphate isomerase/L-lactate dehydrogenase-like FMN-dependent dehydrogenase
VVRNLTAELDITMALAGARRIDEITRNTLTETG